MSTKKSQVAFEFIATYGWAILLILTMIATISYFGILEPKKVLPSRCTIGQELHCVDYVVKTDKEGTNGEIKLKLRNNLGEAITIDNIEIKDENGRDVIRCDPFTSSPKGPSEQEHIGWIPGKTIDIDFVNCDFKGKPIIAGDKAKIKLTFSYYYVASGPDYLRHVNAELFTSVDDLI